MIEAWVIYVLIFCFAAAAAQQAQAGVAGLLRARRGTRSRFESLRGSAGIAGEPAVLRRRAFLRSGPRFLAGVNILLSQSGSRLSLPFLGLIWLLLAVCLAVASPYPELFVARLITSALGAALLLTAYLKRKRAHRRARFGEQLPEVLDIMVRSLRAGHPLPVSLALVAREMSEPAGPEFALVIDEVSYGRSVVEALENLHGRVGYPELRFFVAAASIAQQTGGNLGDVLSRLSKMLRERFKLKRRVRALSAEGRFSGYALSALPLILFALIHLVSPSYYGEFWASSAATTILATSFGLLLIGNVLIHRLVNFEV
jgi:tight adherence protein B